MGLTKMAKAEGATRDVVGYKVLDDIYENTRHKIITFS